MHAILLFEVQGAIFEISLCLNTIKPDERINSTAIANHAARVFV